MTLHLYFTDASRIADASAPIRDAKPTSSLVPNYCPVILDANFWPLQPWTEFLRKYAQNISLNTARAYGRDLFRFAQFLDHNSLGYKTVTNDDFVAYRKHRHSKGLSARSWQREVVIIRAFFSYLIQNGYLSEVPWDRIGQHSVVQPRNNTFDMSVRALSKNQWDTFKNVGLGGETPRGDLDPSFRGKHSLRDTCAAELALTTGMRLQEWRSLLTIDFQPLSTGGKTVTLEATTKGARRRTIYVPQSTWDEIDLYLRTERETLVQKSQKWLRKNLGQMAVVSAYDSTSGMVSYSFNSTQIKARTRDLPLSHRRVLVTLDGDSIKPLSLFLGTNGKPPSQRAWHTTFANANRRVWEAEDVPVFSRVPIVPHDLRHTFAVVLLKNLQIRALRGIEQHGIGRGSISEHIVTNPLLTVQRLLGHASPATTMGYLRFIEDADALVQRAFEEWDDSTKNYADYVIDLLNTERSG